MVVSGSLGLLVPEDRERVFGILFLMKVTGIDQQKATALEREVDDLLCKMKIDHTIDLDSFLIDHADDVEAAHLEEILKKVTQLAIEHDSSDRIRYLGCLN